MEYYVCEAKTAKKLQRIVTNYLGSGWRPAGGMSVVQSRNTSRWWFYQALVRESAAVGPAPSSGEPAKPRATGLGDFD